MKTIFDEAGICARLYNNGQEDRIMLDISGQYDKRMLIELIKKLVVCKKALKKA